jgi:defect-in-organelle-trafficking protein DotA
LPFGVVLASIFFGLGVTLGLYLPLIPFLTFLFGAIGWIIAVIEAMVAAPLIALGLTHPVGHDLLGKAEQSIMLLLSVFVRPAAMVIGFVFSISLIFVAMEIFNIGFLSVIVNYMSNINNISTDGESATIMIGFCGMLLIYAYIALNVVNQCFSLIYLVPEKLLRWIGGAPEFSYTSQLLHDIHSGAKDASSQVGQGAGDSIKTPMVRPGIQASANIKKPKLRDKDGNIVYDDKGKVVRVGWLDLMKKDTVAGIKQDDKKLADVSSNAKDSTSSVELQPLDKGGKKELEGE